jgi:hypothetical protein
MQLGARVSWQSAVPLESLLDRRGGRQIVVSARPRRIKREVSWVVVPEVSWTDRALDMPRERALTHAFPIGSVENRASRRTVEQARVHYAWHDAAVFSQVMCWTNWSRFTGDHVARPEAGRAILEVIA